MTKEDIKKIKEMAESVLEMVSALTPEEDTEVNVDSNSTEVVLKKYIDELQGGKYGFVLDPDEGKVVNRMCWYHRNAVNPFSGYISKDYAEFASVGKKFVDACLAFKWCHDAEYNPDWSNRAEIKWYVIWDYNLSDFVVFHVQSFQSPSTVYYSSQKIAQKCADWLNSWFMQSLDDEV